MDSLQHQLGVLFLSSISQRYLILQKESGSVLVCLRIKSIPTFFAINFVIWFKSLVIFSQLSF